MLKKIVCEKILVGGEVFETTKVTFSFGRIFCFVVLFRQELRIEIDD
jgi:hypothetical protein